MNDEQTILYLNDSRDAMSWERLLQMDPGVYMGETPEGKSAVVKISAHEPVVNLQVVVDGPRVHVTEYFSNHTIKEYDKTLKI